MNILVLAIVTQRFRMPLMSNLLDHGGNSSTAQRIELMRRYLRLFDASSIDALLADREFAGARWLEFLNENNVPFVIRLRENLQVRTEDDGMLRLFRTLVHKSRRGSKRNWTGWLSTMAMVPGNRVKFAAKRIRGKDNLIIATNMEHPRSALRVYRRRWGIECLFSDAKPRGFNIENTHTTDPAKLTTLLGIVNPAVTSAHRCGTRVMGRKPTRRKKHKRLEKSWFRTGFDALRRWIIHEPDDAHLAWQTTIPKRPVKLPEIQPVVFCEKRTHPSP